MTTPLNIIAEIAQGYEGKPELAMHLVKAAARSGADGIKMQLVYADELATSDYQHFELFKSLEMADEVWTALADSARQQNIAFYLDIFGPRSLQLAQKLKVAGVKIHSTDMSNIGFLADLAASEIDMVMLSISGCRVEEIDEAMATLANKQVFLLHGFQSYPTPLDANQISRLHLLQKKYSGLPQCAGLGFADHVPADDPLRFVLAAVALGAGVTLLEKHLTLSKLMQFEDYESALNPDEFATFVHNMKECYTAIGLTDATRSDFGMHASEESYRAATRKHVVAARPIPAGTKIEPDMVSLKRTSSPTYIQDIRASYGRTYAEDLAADQAVTPELLKNGN